MTSTTQSLEKLSQAMTCTGLGPSIDHMAISTAPVSEAGTTPIRKSAGTCRISRVRSIASFNRPLPILERCDRPRGAAARLDNCQPGCLTVGPEEN